MRLSARSPSPRNRTDSPESPTAPPERVVPRCHDGGMVDAGAMSETGEQSTRVEREVEWLVRQVLGDDPREALICHRILVEIYLPWLLRRAVGRARAEQRTWSGIARLLGRSRQAVQQRFDRAFGVADLLPPVLPGSGHGVTKEYLRFLADSRRMRDVADAERRGELVPW